MKRNLYTVLSGLVFLSAVLIGCNKQEVRTVTTARIDGVNGDKEVEIFVGDTAKLKFIISPADASAEVVWSASAAIAKMDEKKYGSSRYVELIGLKPGKSTITATVNGNPTLTDTCTLIVKPLPALVDSVRLFKASTEKVVDTLEITLGYSDTLDFDVFLANEWMSFSDAEDETSAELSAEWSVDDETVIASSGDGIFVGLVADSETKVYIEVSSKYETSKFKDEKTVIDSCVVKVLGDK